MEFFDNRKAPLPLDLQHAVAGWETDPYSGTPPVGPSPMSVENPAEVYGDLQSAAGARPLKPAQDEAWQQMYREWNAVIAERDEAIKECTDLRADIVNVARLNAKITRELTDSNERRHDLRTMLEVSNTDRDHARAWRDRYHKMFIGMLDRVQRLEPECDDARNWAGVGWRRADKAERERETIETEVRRLLSVLENWGLVCECGDVMRTEDWGKICDCPPDAPICDHPLGRRCPKCGRESDG
jgi:hypothetical protein